MTARRTITSAISKEPIQSGVRPRNGRSFDVFDGSSAKIISERDDVCGSFRKPAFPRVLPHDIPSRDTDRSPPVRYVIDAFRCTAATTVRRRVKIFNFYENTRFSWVHEFPGRGAITISERHGAPSRCLHYSAARSSSVRENGSGNGRSPLSPIGFVPRIRGPNRDAIFGTLLPQARKLKIVKKK